MTIKIKSPAEIAKMRLAGKLASEVLQMIAPYVVAGVSTDELNSICHNYITCEQQAIPAPLNYKGFPKSICTSVNHVVCHGIPNDKILKQGDIINIDVTVIKDGWHGDTSKMFYVGEPPIMAKRLCTATQQSLYAAIRQIKPGKSLNDIAKAIEHIAQAERFTIVREYCGHGIGQKFHEAPQVLHYSCLENEITLREGMVFTIEPMLNAGTAQVKLLKNDGWTVVTKDRQLSAQWEHTIAVTTTGYEVLTKREEEKSLI